MGGRLVDVAFQLRAVAVMRGRHIEVKAHSGSRPFESHLARGLHSIPRDHSRRGRRVVGTTRGCVGVRLQLYFWHTKSRDGVMAWRNRQLRWLSVSQATCTRPSNGSVRPAARAAARSSRMRSVTGSAPRLRPRWFGSTRRAIDASPRAVERSRPPKPLPFAYSRPRTGRCGGARSGGPICPHPRAGVRLSFSPGMKPMLSVSWGSRTAPHKARARVVPPLAVKDLLHHLEGMVGLSGYPFTARPASRGGRR